VFGSGPDFPAAFKMELALGQWLPHEELSQARAFAVLGPKVRQELFGAENPLGSRIEIGGYRYRGDRRDQVQGQRAGMGLR